MSYVQLLLSHQSVYRHIGRVTAKQDMQSLMRHMQSQSLCYVKCAIGQSQWWPVIQGWWGWAPHLFIYLFNLGGLACFTYYFGINMCQFANNVEKYIYIIKLIKLRTNIVSFLFSWVRQLQNAVVSAYFSAFCGGGATQQKIWSVAPWLTQCSVTHGDTTSPSCLRVDLKKFYPLGSCC